MTNLKDKLIAAGLQANVFEETLNVVGGKGPQANRVNLDPANSENMTERELIFYVRAIHQVLSQPKRSIAKKWNFKLSAGSLLPSVETLSFVKGVEDASGSPAVYTPLFEDIVLCYGVRWDRGIHILNQDQFESWGVSMERVRAAARSMLYHHSESLKWTPAEESLLKFTQGDGSDAARFTILEDKFFGEINADFRFAFPSPDLLVGNFETSEDQEFSASVRALFEKQDAPLSADIFRFKQGKISRVEC